MSLIPSTIPFVRSKDAIAIDIGSYSIKILFIKKSGRSYSLVKWGTVPLQDINRDVSPTEKKNAIISRLAEFLAVENISVKNIVTSVSGNQVIVRHVQFPRMSREELEKTMTVFPRDENGNPYIYDYMIKGFFKDTQGAMNRISGSSKMTAFKKIIDGLIFIKERKIPFTLPTGKAILECTRPLRASTPQGQVVSLVSSEAIPEGSTLEFTIQSMDEKLLNNVKGWLDYGSYRGLGQWRNSGKGRFKWKMLEAVPAKSKPKKKRRKK